MLNIVNFTGHYLPFVDYWTFSDRLIVGLKFRLKIDSLVNNMCALRSTGQQTIGKKIMATCLAVAHSTMSG